MAAITSSAAVAGVLVRKPRTPVNYLMMLDVAAKLMWLRGGDLNPRPLGYEPNELPDCSTPRHVVSGTNRTANAYGLTDPNEENVQL
jgi:hypothetical protein